MKDTMKRSIKLATILIILPLFALVMLNSRHVQAGATAQEFDAATMFKAKCALCHGTKAEKKFDAMLPDAELVEFILKGKKGEKPPFMPEYATKGVTAENALALVTHMKQLRVTAPAEAPKTVAEVPTAAEAPKTAPEAPKAAEVPKTAPEAPKAAEAPKRPLDPK